MGGEAYIHLRLTMLAAAAGCIDAASFLALDQVFTANQTGNTVLLGIAIGQGDGAAMARSGASVAAFVVGVMVAARLLRSAPGGWSGRVAAVLGAEAVLLGVAAVLWEPLGIPALTAVIAAAMGLQSAAAVQVGVPGVSTTFVTGTLTRIASQLVGGRESPREAAPTAVWMACLGGAIAGAALIELLGAAATVAAGAGVVAISAVPVRRARRSR